MAEFKPNIYPIIYWALAFGVLAGVVLYLIALLGQFITVVWVPVFLLGMAWGAYRNYQKQKKAWSQNTGATFPTQSPVNEFKQAFRDIRESSQELLTQQAEQAQEVPPQEEEYIAEQEVIAAPDDTAVVEPEETIQNPPVPPQPPQTPQV